MERRGQIQELFGRLNHWGWWTKWIQGVKKSERVKESTEDPRLGHPETDTVHLVRNEFEG